MRLTAEEKRMAAGKNGTAAKLAMEMIVEAWEMARLTGHKAMIDHSGAMLIPQSCVLIAPFHDRGFRVVMIDSAKYAYYMRSEFEIEMILGAVTDCVSAATSGIPSTQERI